VIALQLFERMCMLLGGRIAETIIFNSVTSGMLIAFFVSFSHNHPVFIARQHTAADTRY